ncbi:hypothetical protein SCHPADRAFT_668807 [Schizopora paradoxa]|uniref:Uncharacterized protein n=1 Tax=Schizopora paradoxa TaxID=27342 RepID=A0A0H2R6N8_9AGAM|nr:hypothetical protein SCHPADRAFT_668807 [Schizopora paradoxa]
MNASWSALNFDDLHQSTLSGGWHVWRAPLDSVQEPRGAYRASAKCICLIAWPALNTLCNVPHSGTSVQKRRQTFVRFLVCVKKYVDENSSRCKLHFCAFKAVKVTYIQGSPWKRTHQESACTFTRKIDLSEFKADNTLSRSDKHPPSRSTMSAVAQTSPPHIRLRQLSGVYAHLPSVHYSIANGRCTAVLTFPCSIPRVRWDGGDPEWLSEDLRTGTAMLTVEMDGCLRHVWGIPTGVKKSDVTCNRFVSDCIISLEYPVPPCRTFVPSKLPYELF